MNLRLFVSAFAVAVAFSVPAHANPFGTSESSCVAAAEASAKQYEHEQKIIWGKMGGTIQDFKQQRYFNSWKGLCLLDVRFKIAQGGKIVTTRYLVDSFERRIYGTYYGVGEGGGASRSLTCNYGVAFNEAGHCDGEDEFETVISQLVK